jgi:hypothetical protein
MSGDRWFVLLDVTETLGWIMRVVEGLGTREHSARRELSELSEAIARELSFGSLERSYSREDLRRDSL